MNCWTYCDVPKGDLVFLFLCFHSPPTSPSLAVPLCLVHQPPYRPMVGPDCLIIISMIFVIYFHFIWPIYFTLQYISLSHLVSELVSELVRDSGAPWGETAPGSLLLGAELCVQGQPDPGWAVQAVSGSTELLQEGTGPEHCAEPLSTSHSSGGPGVEVSPACFIQVWTKAARVESNCLCVLLSLISTAIVLSALPALLGSSPLSLLSTSSPVKFISLVLLTVSLLPWAACKCWVYCLR